MSYLVPGNTRHQHLKSWAHEKIYLVYRHSDSIKYFSTRHFRVGHVWPLTYRRPQLNLGKCKYCMYVSGQQAAIATAAAAALPRRPGRAMGFWQYQSREKTVLVRKTNK